MERLLCVLIGYLFGCLQTSYLVGRLYKHIDIRQYGSGNAGGTNAMRVLGTKVGILCILGDALKGVLALLLTALLFGFESRHLLLYAGLGAICGHNFPFYMGFRGGKGVAATLGIIAFIDWRILLLAGIPALMIILVGRLMSLASLEIVTVFPLAMIFFYAGTPYFAEILILSLLFSAMVYWRHWDNIKRLLNGTERRIGDKVKIQEKTGDGEPDGNRKRE